MFNFNYEEREPYYLELLTSFGLKPQEAKVYLSCLKLGPSTVSQIAKQANMQRTFVYDVIEDLKKKGLISPVEGEGKSRFQAVSIDSVKSLLKEKFERFEAFLPELQSLEQPVNRPSVRFFEGREGIKAALQDTINQPAGSEILCFSNAEGFYTKEKEFEKWYVSERAKRKIRMRFIAPDNPETMEYIKQDKKHLRETRAVPADLFPFSAEVDIYGNKVAILSLDQEEPIGIIIESEAIAKTQRMIFELAWKGAEKR